MKSLKEYISTVNHQIKYKLLFYVQSVFGSNVIYESSVTEPQVIENDQPAFNTVTINQEIILEPRVKNEDIIPTYIKLNKIQVRSLYNLVCNSYFDDDKWNRLKNHSLQTNIHSELGFAMREAICDEYCFPALN